MIKKPLIIIISILFLDSYSMQEPTVSFVTVDGEKIAIQKKTINYIPLLKNLIDTVGTDQPIDLSNHFFLTAANIKNLINIIENPNIPKDVLVKENAEEKEKTDSIIKDCAQKQDIVSYIQSIACANSLKLSPHFTKILIQHMFDTTPVLLKDKETKRIIEEYAQSVLKNKHLKSYIQDAFNNKGYSSLRLSYSAPLTTNKAPLMQRGSLFVIAEQDGFIFIEKVQGSWQKKLKRYPKDPVYPYHPKGMKEMYTKEICILDSRNRLIEYDLGYKDDVLKVMDWREPKDSVSDDQWSYDRRGTIAVANQNENDVIFYTYLSRDISFGSLKRRKPMPLRNAVDKLQFIQLQVGTHNIYCSILLIASQNILYGFYMTQRESQQLEINYYLKELNDIASHTEQKKFKGFDACNDRYNSSGRLILFTDKEVSLNTIKFGETTSIDNSTLAVKEEVSFTFDDLVEKASFFEENNILVKTRNQYIVFRKKEEESPYDKVSSWERTQLPLQLSNAVASGNGGIAGIKSKKFAIYQPKQISLLDMIQYDYYAKQNDIRSLEKLINNEKIVTWSDRWNSIKSVIFPSQTPEKKTARNKKIGPFTFSPDSSFAKLYFNEKQRELYNRESLTPIEEQK